MMAEHGTAGTVRLYGTPAEETVVGKVYMARDGLFDDLDASIVWHPGQRTAVSNNRARALNNFEVSFRGQAAHGAFDPWNGRSALDAVELMNHGVNMMREHVEPSARIHYVIPNAGDAPNVVPEYARVWYYVRDTTRTAVEESYEWILDIADGAAKMTRTEYEVFLITGVHPYTLVRPLQEAMQANLERVGPPRFSESDQTFGRKLQAFLKVETSGLRDTIDHLADQPLPAGGGSSDVAEVSYIAPTVEFSVTTAAEHIPWHSWATSASHGTPGSIKGAQVATKALALMGAEIILDAESAAAREGGACGDDRGGSLQVADTGGAGGAAAEEGWGLTPNPPPPPASPRSPSAAATPGRRTGASASIRRTGRRTSRSRRRRRTPSSPSWPRSPRRPAGRS